MARNSHTITMWACAILLMHICLLEKSRKPQPTYRNGQERGLGRKERTGPAALLVGLLSSQPHTPDAGTVMSSQRYSRASPRLPKPQKRVVIHSFKKLLLSAVLRYSTGARFKQLFSLLKNNIRAHFSSLSSVIHLLQPLYVWPPHNWPPLTLAASYATRLGL